MKAEKNLSGKHNIKFMLLKDKGHKPTYTTDAVRSLVRYAKMRRRRRRFKLLETAKQKESFLRKFDWNRMTEQDDNVWTEIINTLNN